MQSNLDLDIHNYVNYAIQLGKLFLTQALSQTKKNVFELQTGIKLADLNSRLLI